METLIEPQTTRIPFQEFWPAAGQNTLGLAPPSKPLPDFLITAENGALEAAFADVVLGLANVLDSQPGFRGGLVTSGADWSRAYATAIENNQLASWRDACRRVTYFALDDLESLHRKFASQRELISLLDDLVGMRMPCILTGRSNPLAAAELLPELSGRLSAGLTIPLHPPDVATRQAYLGQLAVEHGLEITDAGTSLLANQFSGTMVELRSAFLQLAQSLPLDRKIDVLLLRRLLRAQGDTEVDLPLSLIVATVGRYFQLNKAKIVGATRRRGIAHARYIAIYLSRQLSKSTLKGIGAFFGGRDHTTILHAYRKIEEQLESDPATRTAVEAITNQLMKGRT